MKANQLRVNSVVYYDIGEKIIDYMPTRLDVQDLNWCLNSNADFNIRHKPIELTREIRTQLGFDHEHKLTADIIYRFSDNMLYIHNRPMMRIMYLHLLQNVYFDLTGEELNCSKLFNQ